MSEGLGAFTEPHAPSTTFCADTSAGACHNSARLGAGDQPVDRPGMPSNRLTVTIAGTSGETIGCRRLNEVPLDSESNQRGAALDLQLIHDAVLVKSHGARRDAQNARLSLIHISEPTRQ